MSHHHFCDAEGHEWECASPSCECICGLLMEGHDHSECPIELRACTAHADGEVGASAEPESDAVQIDFSILSSERQQSKDRCQCGCADLTPGTAVGFCLWCDHRYADYSPKIESEHFAQHCPGAPEELKESSLTRLAKRGESGK